MHLKMSHDLLALVSVNIWRYKFTFGAIYLTTWMPNGPSERLKGQSISTGLSTIAKLAVIWIVLKCYYVVDLILDSISVILVFYCKF